MLTQITALLTAADDRGEGCDEIDQVLKMIEAAVVTEAGTTHKWTDGWGNDRESEICGQFDRGEFHWVTIWDERMNEFRTLVAGPRSLYGAAAFEQLSESEQNMLFGMLMDEAGDMSTRDRAHAMLEDMDLDYMRTMLSEGEEDLGDDPLGDWHGRNE